MKLNQKRKKCRPIKAHRAGIWLTRLPPTPILTTIVFVCMIVSVVFYINMCIARFFWSPDWLHLKPDRFTDQTGRLTSVNRLNCHFCLKFEFIRFFPLTGQIGPIYRNRWAAVWSNRSVKKPRSSLVLLTSSRPAPTAPPSFFHPFIHIAII